MTTNLNLDDVAPALNDGVQEDTETVIPVTDGGLAREVDMAEEALISAQVPVMVRAGAARLVQPITDMRPAADGSLTEVTALAQLNQDTIAYLLNKRAAKFMKYDGRGKRWRAIDPPKTIVATLLNKGEWCFPKVTGVITAPTLRPDGTILYQPGYDPATRLWHAPAETLDLPSVGDTRQAAEAGLQLLLDLLEEFAFVKDLDRAVALAALMTPVLRGACDVVPMILTLAHTASSGKSFLADITNTIVRGQKCPVITAVEATEEMEKRLGALILEGAQIISLDNCSHDLGGDLLCQITERTLIRIRILGKSQTPECEWCGTVIANGNNIRLLDDMTRRAIICNLDPKLERPEQRRFKHNPIELVMADRGAYIAAVLSIARAYLASGAAVECTPIASYGRWSRMVREPLIWLGQADPVASMEQARAIDPNRTAARELVGHWADWLGCEQSYTSNDIIRVANAGEKIKETETWIYHHPEFRELLIARCGTGGRIEARKLGNWLMSIRGQIHNDHRIDLIQSGDHGNKYKLTALKPDDSHF